MELRTLTDRPRDFFLSAFRDFYGEVSRHRSEWEADSEEAGRARGARVSRALIDRLDAYAEAARDLPPRAEEEFRDVRYALAALADESFLFADGSRAVWSEFLIERQRFGTAVAGDEILDRIEGLLADPDDASADLATVYLLTLSLGFQGRLRARTGDGVEQFRRRLFKLLYRRGPRLSERSGPLFPAAYEGVAKGGREPVMSRQGRWVLILILAVVAYVGITSAWWWAETGPVRANIQEIIRASEGRG